MLAAQKSFPTRRKLWRARSNSPLPKTSSSSPARSTSSANCAANGCLAKARGQFLPSFDEVSRQGIRCGPTSDKPTYLDLAQAVDNSSIQAVQTGGNNFQMHV